MADLWAVIKALFSAPFPIFLLVLIVGAIWFCTWAERKWM